MDDIGSPQRDVLRAFGATELPVPLVGGQGQNYRSGTLVLKPARDDEETTWINEFYLTVAGDRFRLPQPIRTDDGDFVSGGWQAWTYLPGRHEPGRWFDEIDLCVRFHEAIAGLPRPAYFDRRDQNPWVIADKVTWGEMEIEHHPRIAPAVERLSMCLRPVDAPSQLIHGDFGGNVLFSDGLPPAVIDFSPYWRPAAFALGVVIADAIVWGGAPMSLIEAGDPFPDFRQHLLRAELRRVLELETIHTIYGHDMLGEIDAHMPLIEAISN
jgi:uncharacterized protein (TIGR02569 family)